MVTLLPFFVYETSFAIRTTLSALAAG